MAAKYFSGYTRSGTRFGPPPTTPVCSGYQPPSTNEPRVVYSNALSASMSIPQFSQNLDCFTSAIDAMKPMLESLKPTNDVETGIINYLRLLTGHLRDLKQEFGVMAKRYDDRFDECRKRTYDVELTVHKAEQYTRRDTVTVVGVNMPESETQSSLSTVVAKTMCDSGETVSPEDFSACHRNSTQTRVVRGKTLPPSITVRFKTVSKKDSVLRSYKNFDQAKARPRPVKLYQSLTPHYSNLRNGIVNCLTPGEKRKEYGISLSGQKIKWCTYQSPTAGLVYKLESGAYFKGIHTWEQFIDSFIEKFPEALSA